MKNEYNISSEDILWKGKKGLGPILVGKMMPYIAVYIAVAIFFLYKENSVVNPIIKPIASLTLLLGAVTISSLIIRLILDAFFTQYTITDKAIYIKRGLISTVTEVKMFADISNIVVQRSLSNKLTNTGCVSLICNRPVKTSSDFPFNEMKIENIFDYNQVYNLIRDNQDNYIS